MEWIKTLLEYLWLRNKLPSVGKDMCFLCDCIHGTGATPCCAVIVFTCRYCWERKHLAFLCYFRKCIVNWLYSITSVWWMRVGNIQMYIKQVYFRDLLKTWNDFSLVFNVVSCSTTLAYRGPQLSLQLSAVEPCQISVVWFSALGFLETTPAV